MLIQIFMIRTTFAFNVFPKYAIFLYMVQFLVHLKPTGHTLLMTFQSNIIEVLLMFIFGYIFAESVYSDNRRMWQLGGPEALTAL